MTCKPPELNELEWALAATACEYHAQIVARRGEAELAAAYVAVGKKIDAQFKVNAERRKGVTP